MQVHSALARKSYFAIALPLALALWATVAPVSAKEFMSQDELLATIPGSIIDSKDKKGVQWVQSYSAYKGGKKEGIIKGYYGKEPIESKWYVEGNQWCEDWGSGSACWDVERVNDKSLRMYENGKPKKNLWVMR